MFGQMTEMFPSKSHTTEVIPSKNNQINLESSYKHKNLDPSGVDPSPEMDIVLEEKNYLTAKFITHQ